MALYQYVFTDLATDQVRTELPLTNVSFTREVNGPGGWSAELPLSIVKDGYELVRASELAEADTALYVLRDNVVVFGGILWAVNASSDQETLRVGGQGFWSYFRHRHIRKNLVFTAADQFEIVETIIDHAQDDFADGNLGVTVTRTPTTSGVTRDRRYSVHEYKNVGEAIEQLASVVNGFDFELEAGGSFGAFTKTLQVWYPQRGRKTDIVWEVGKNVQLLDYTADGIERANVVTAVGAGEGARMIRSHAVDSTAKLRIERIEQFKDVNNSTTLTAHAQAALNFYKNSKRSARVQVVNQADAPLGSYIPGDQVRLRVSRGYLDIDEFWRIMSYTVQPDDSGSEIVTAELLPVDAFAT